VKMNNPEQKFSCDYEHQPYCSICSKNKTIVT
jgi:hypothetical protein